MRDDTLIVISGRLFVALLMILSLRVMTHYLPPHEYGILAIFAVFQTLAGLVFISPIGQYLNRHTHEWVDSGLILPYMRVISRYWLIVSIAVGMGALLWLSSRLYSDAWDMAIISAAAIAAMIYANTAFVTNTSRLNMVGNRRASVLWQVTGTSLALGASWFLVSRNTGAIGWFVGQVVGFIIAGWGAHRAFARQAVANTVKGHFTFNEILPVNVWKVYCFPLAVIAVFTWLDSSAYRFALEPSWGLHRFGMFAMALTIPVQMTAVIESVVQQMVYPYVFRGLSDGEGHEEAQTAVVSDLVMFLSPLYLIWGTFLVLASEPLMILLTDTIYHDAAVFLIVGIALELLRLMYSPWLFVSQALKDFRDIQTPFFVSALLITVAGFMTIRNQYDEWVFGLCLLSAAVIKFLIIVSRTTRKFHFRIPLKPIGLTGAIFLVALTTKYSSKLLEVDTWQHAVYMVAGAGVLTLLLGYMLVINNPSFKRLSQFSLGAK